MAGAGKLLVWGVDHHRADTATRERVHLDGDAVRALLASLADEPDFVSCIPLSTCNRTEIYVERKDGFPAGEALPRSLRAAGVDPDPFVGDAGLRLQGREAVAHLYRVAAGLESMMLGEPQITAQLKEAYRRAKEHGELGPVIMRAFQGAFRAGKRVRTRTRISGGAVSVAFAAVELARKFFTRLEDQKALLVGAGETGALAAHHFLQQGVGALTVVNRSPEKACRLADDLNDGKALRARARPWEELVSAMAGANLVLTTTGAPDPVITPSMVTAAMRERRRKPLFFMDIAVPRDVHPDVGGEGVYVFGLDDLDEIVQKNLAARRREIPAAEAILAKELDEFAGWLRDLDLRPTVEEFQAFLEALKEKQVGWVRKQESDEVAAAVEQSLQQFIKKVLGRSMASLRDAKTQEERLQHLSTLRRLFADDRRPGA